MCGRFYQGGTKEILFHKMSAAGENLRCQSGTKEILPHKISAAGENFCIGVVRFCGFTVLPPL